MIDDLLMKSSTIKWAIFVGIVSYISAITNTTTMAKYSALIPFVTLAVFWSSAEAHYNKYQDDVIDAMSNYFIEEMHELPEPHKTRLINKLTEAKNRQWDDVTEYFRYIQRLMLEILSELYRSKRSVQSSKNVEPLMKIANMFSEGKARVSY